MIEQDTFKSLIALKDGREKGKQPKTKMTKNMNTQFTQMARIKKENLLRLISKVKQHQDISLYTHHTGKNFKEP